MAVFSNLHTESGLANLEKYLAGKTFISGDLISKDDVKVFGAVSQKPGDAFPNAARWYDSVNSLLSARFAGQAVGVKFISDSAPAAAVPTVEEEKKADEDDDDLDLFGEETEEDKKAAAEREAAKKTSTKKPDLTKSLDRKWSMFGGGITFLIGSALGGSAHNILMLIIGRIFLGIGVGLTNQAVPLYFSEMAPARLRGMLNISFQFMITLGTLVATVVNYSTTKIGSWGWRISLGLAAVPTCIITISTLFIPDTPNSLLDRGYQIKAKETLKRIRGTNKIETEYNDMVLASEEAWKIDHPWKIILDRKYRPQLTMAILIPFFHHLSSFNMILFYAHVLLKSLGFENDASLASAVIIGSANLLATLVSFVSVDKFGRRILLFQGGLQMLISEIVVRTLMAVKFGTNAEETVPSKSVSAVLLVFVCMYVAGFAWSWGPLGWLMPSEIFSLEVRSAGQSITISLNMLITFVVLQTSLSLLCHMKYGLFFFFGTWIVAKTLFVAFFLPETKNVPVEEMMLVWKKHWYWKRFVVDDDDEVEDEGMQNCQLSPK